MLTRRNFVRTVGIGAAGALTSSWIGARGREDASGRARARVARADGRASGEPHRPLEQREPARAGQGGHRRGAEGVRTERRGARTLLGRGRRAHRGARQEAQRAAAEHPARLRLDADPAHGDARVHGAHQGARRHDSDLRGVRRLRRPDGPPGPRGAARRRLQDGSRSDAHRGAGRGPRVLLQSEQPDRDLHRRARVTRLLRARQPQLAGDDHPRRRGVLRLRDGSRSRDVHPDRRRRPAHRRRADVLEGVRHGRPSHGLRRRTRRHHRARCRRGTAPPARAL